MIISNQIASALSNSPINLVPQPTSSTNFQVPNDPSGITTLGAQIAAGASSLQYPSDRPKYYITFDIYDYNRTSLTSVATTQLAGYPSIVLPLPQQLVGLHQINWNDHADVGVAAGNIINTLTPTIRGATQSSTALAAGAAAVAGATTASALAGVAKQFGDLTGLSAGISEAASGFESIAGFVPNQFLTMLLVGPTYHRREFVWSFSPNTFQEADTLRQIIRVFNDASAPGLALGGAIWKFPCIFWISLWPNSKFLMKYKPCVLEDFTVNYFGAGRASFYHDPTGATDGSGNAPEGITIHAKFQELEYWTQGNYSGQGGGDTTNNPRDVYNTTTPSSSSSASSPSTSTGTVTGGNPTTVSPDTPPGSIGNPAGD